MPDGCLDIIYSRETGLRAIGAMTVEQRRDLPAGTRTAGVRFHPGLAGVFLGAAPSELTDRSVRLEDLLGRKGRELEACIAEVKTRAELAQMLVARLCRVPDRPLNAVQRAIEAITAAHGDIDLDFVSHQANLSPRQFRRRCLEETDSRRANSAASFDFAMPGG